MSTLELRKRPVGCASDLALEEVLAGDLAGTPDEARLRRHIDDCSYCRERLAARAADVALVPDPALRVALLAEETRRRAWRRRFKTTGAAVAGVAAAGLLAWRLAAPTPGGRPDRRDEPDEPGERSSGRTKGELALTVHVKRAGGAIEALTGQGRLRAGDEMRFVLAPARAGHAVVLGLDAAPSVTVYVPARATDGPLAIEPRGPVTLPGSIVSDATAGFERIVAVVCDREIPTATVRALAERALAQAGGRPEAVAALGTGCAEASVLLHKDPP
jgi:hypothetical protein